LATKLARQKDVLWHESFGEKRTKQIDLSASRTINAWLRNKTLQKTSQSKKQTVHGKSKSESLTTVKKTTGV
jgi:hypothetical protein